MELIPPFSRDFDSESNAEIKVARVLSHIQSDDAVAFHSFHLSKTRSSKMGEADFVLLWEGAIIILEVKGGSLGRADGIWHQTGRNGRHVLSKSPFDQARRARFAFRDMMLELLPNEDFSYGHAVVTPDCVLDEDPEIPNYEYIGMLDMDPSRMARRLSFIASEARTRPNGSRWPKRDLSPVRKRLRRDLDSMVSVVQYEQMIERRRVDLLRDQVDFLESARINPRIVLEGGAGTGKTLVALEGAIREAARGTSVTFVCSTPEALEAARRVAGPSGVSLVVSKNLPLQEPAELLIVDEAQDAMNAGDLDRIFTSVLGGMDDGSWWLLLDANNQAQVSGKYEEDSFELVASIGGCARVRLGRNVRNTDPVIQAAQIYLNADLGSSRVGPGPKIESQLAQTADKVPQLLRDRIHELRDDRVPSSQMAVVDVAETPAFLHSHGTSGTFEGVRIWTSAQIKGLEFPHVMLVGLDDLDSQASKNLLYVGLTRPSVSLWMAPQPRAWEFLRERVKTFYLTRKDDQ